MKPSDLIQLATKYIFPLLLILVGLALVMMGAGSDEIKNVECLGEIVPSKTVEQTDYFKYAGYSFLLLSVVTALFVAGIIKRTVAVVLGITVFPVLGAYLMYLNYDAVNAQIQWKENKEKVYSATKQRLKDIRDAQVEYKVKYGRYSPDFNELMRFLREDKVANIRKEGTPPDRKINLREAYLLGYDTIKFIIPNENIAEMDAVRLGAIARDGSKADLIDQLFKNPVEKKQFMELAALVRDTTYIPVTEKLFTGGSAKNRDENFPFELDSLPWRPWSGGKVKLVMITDSIAKNDSVYAPVFLVKDPSPFKFEYLDDECKSRDTLIIGSLSSSSTNGNWK
jgi:hypothetical protein